jgi:hypothetical protein
MLLDNFVMVVKHFVKHAYYYIIIIKDSHWKISVSQDMKPLWIEFLHD